MLESPDCSIIPTKNNTFLISTTDYFYPLVNDPYIQGQIAACNVLSDLYSLGVTSCDNMLMILAISRQMNELERQVSTTEIIRGFNDKANEAGTRITGGQTVFNPWPIIGGVAMSVCSEGEFIRPCNAQVGDVLVLTKPIGTQLAVNLYEWFNTKRHLFEQLDPLPTEQFVMDAYGAACYYMSFLNRTAAELMHKYNARGSTDVTGFGILGHTQNLADIQHNDVDLVIRKLPIINQINTIDKQVRNFRLVEGYSAETSGGLLVMLPGDQAQAYIDEFQQKTGQPAWIIGDITVGTKKASIDENVEIINV